MLSEYGCGENKFVRVKLIVARALPTETNVEIGTSQSKSGTSINSSNSGLLQASLSTKQLPPETDRERVPY